MPRTLTASSSRSPGSSPPSASIPMSRSARLLSTSTPSSRSTEPPPQAVASLPTQLNCLRRLAARPCPFDGSRRAAIFVWLRRIRPMVLTDHEKAAFADNGYVRVPGAFSVETARLLRDRVWEALGPSGIDRHRPETWAVESPAHLQQLKRLPEFAGIGTPRTVGAIDDILGADEWDVPRDWGAFFVLFPTG